MRHAVPATDEELDDEDAFPRLSLEQIAVLEAAGERRTLAQGEVLTRAGEVAREFCVVTRGALAGALATSTPRMSGRKWSSTPCRARQRSAKRRTSGGRPSAARVITRRWGWIP